MSEMKYLSPDEIFNDVRSHLAPEFVIELKQTSEDKLPQYYNSIGRWICNQYNLWSVDNPYVNMCDPNADNFPDKISQKIIERIWSNKL